MSMLCIVNYGSGNIAAIANICERERIPYAIVSEPHDLVQGSHYLLPGVGSFDPTIEALQHSGLLAALEDQVFGAGKHIMGICVGMHLLANSSDEGERPGLGWIPGHVRKIDSRALSHPPHLPHMGWNDIQPRKHEALLEGVDPQVGFYFLHSYFFDATEPDDVVATVRYGADLPCIVKKGRVVGAQFHPEKSHSNGIRFLKNFVGAE